MKETIWLHELTNASTEDAGDDTHARILDAAYALFLTFGLRRTTIEDIAKRAGIGRPTLYRRFGDKDAVMQAVIMRESRRLTAAVWSQVQDIHDPAQMLARSFVVATRTVATHPLTQRLLQTEAEFILPHMTLKAGPFIDVGHMLVGPGIKKLQAAGHFPQADIDYLLEALARLFISIVLTPSQLVDAGDEKKLEKMAQALILPMLKKPE
ncbi:MAG: TetR/AcrR family transcriptional regulator [Moraxellaceae bacterium]